MKTNLELNKLLLSDKFQKERPDFNLHSRINMRFKNKPSGMSLLYKNGYFWNQISWSLFN